MGEVTFIPDDDGNWTGFWETANDQYAAEVLEEYMGGVKFEGLEVLGYNNNSVLLTADDASVATYDLNGRLGPQGTQQTESDILAVQAAAADSGGGDPV
jgi:hypothetical protein